MYFWCGIFDGLFGIEYENLLLGGICLSRSLLEVVFLGVRTVATLSFVQRRHCHLNVEIQTGRTLSSK